MLRVFAGSSTGLLPVSWTSTAQQCGHLPARRILQRYAISIRTATTLNLQALDEKWQKIWKEDLHRRKCNGKEKAYILAMFPYPSGALHMGHVRVYTIADVLARFQRMKGCSTGKDVIYPMGWDAFGLPAENAAIERGLDPAEWTRTNIAKMKEQLQGMNTDIDWSRELITCSPDFYKHTQRIFLLLYEHGLAYQAESLVNYDPIDRTVLANEQVDSNGFSWRSGAKVEKLNLKQWFLKITEYKEKLLEDLEILTKWPGRVISMQQNWLGRSQGTKLSFDVESEKESDINSISVFTTRLDTLAGVRFLALSATHPLVIEHAKVDRDLQAFIDTIPNLPEGSKVGFRLRGVTARNPLSKVGMAPMIAGRQLEIWVAPYVKSDYGEGAIMGVPAHDERDFAFWKESQGEAPIYPVVQASENKSTQLGRSKDVFTSTGILTEHCGRYAGRTSEEADEQILNDLQNVGAFAERQVTWRLRDWLISRQRYWGAPIPIIHCNSCGPVPVPTADLPVELPKLNPKQFEQRKGNPLETAEDWVNVPCPRCGSPAKRDTDTMDTFVDSSWYMFRFTDPHNPEIPFTPVKVNEYMPVNTYVGGIEHAILHLLYARFMGKFLAKEGMWEGGRVPEVRGEPFKQLISQGMVHGKTYSDPVTGRFLKPDEVDLSDLNHPLIRITKQAPNISFEKMSKSKYNGVDPTDVISRYGADVTRIHMLFQAPVSEVLEWEEARIAGVQRWLQRLYKHVKNASIILESPRASGNQKTLQNDNPYGMIEVSRLSQAQTSLYLKTEQTISSITTALSETHTLNTCISDLMTLTNEIGSVQEESMPSALVYHVTRTIIKLLGPFAPAFAEECWQVLHQDIKGLDTMSTIFEQPWPETKKLAQLEAWASKNMKVPCAIMENGKLRMVLDCEPIPATISEEEKLSWVLQQIRGHEKGQEWLEKKKQAGGWKKVIIVKHGQTINFVGANKN